MLFTSRVVSKKESDPDFFRSCDLVLLFVDHLAISPQCSLRKEVIQPQLPLQLPCYDFVPVISPAFGGSPR